VVDEEKQWRMRSGGVETAHCLACKDPEVRSRHLPALVPLTGPHRTVLS